MDSLHQISDVTIEKRDYDVNNVITMQKARSFGLT